MTDAVDAGRSSGARLSTVTIDDGGRRFPARLAEPVAPPIEGCPVVAFGHGFVQRASSYDSLLAGIAARGYVVVAPDTRTGPWPSHGGFADDLWRAAVVIRERHTWQGAGRGIVLGGHSMGAAVALLAASRHPDVDAVVTLSALETRPAATLDAIVAPTLFVVGSQDRIVPPARSRRLYDSMSTPAQWAAIRGGYHCGFLDRARWGDAGCDRGDLSRHEQLDVTVGLVADWLDVTFHGGELNAPPGVDLERPRRRG